MADKMTVAQMRDFLNLTPASVMSVYSGKPGCACGCNGNYRYNSEHAKQAAIRRGYAIDADEINDRQVKRILNLVQEHYDAVRFIDAGIYALDLGERTYTVYTLEAR